MWARRRAVARRWRDPAPAGAVAGREHRSYWVARHRAARLELDAAMLALEPLRVACEAARGLANVAPEAPEPVNALAVRRAMDALRDDLLRPPDDPPEADAATDTPAGAEPDKAAA